MKKGFTLIELIMVIVIIGILAATALPRFIDLSNKAKEAAAKGTLANVRTAVAVQYANNAVNGITPLFPATIVASMFSDNKIPLEPWSGTNEVAASASPPTGTAGGWLYDNATGRVWINHTSYSSY